MTPAFDYILNQAPFFLLVAGRCFGMLFTLPLFSMRTVSRIAKVALGGYISFIVMPSANFSAYMNIGQSDGAFSLYYIALLAGEVMIGVIIGFFVTIIFSAFSTAGQFFSFQIGFSASEVYDAVSQVENPLVGQFFNLIAMLVFLQNHWFQKLFLYGFARTFESLDVFVFFYSTDAVVKFLMSGLTHLFADALIISLPIMGVLLLITVCNGILSKAAPQINMLSEGFPIMIMLCFFLIINLLPSMIDFFTRSFDSGLTSLFSVLSSIGNGD